MRLATALPVRRRRAALALTGVLALAGCTEALAGCGGGETVRVRGSAVTLTLDEYRILPRTLSVPAGRLRILAENRGVLTHNLVVQLADLDSNGEAVTIARTATIKPGASASLLTPPLRAGHRYVLASSIANQAVLGMSGTLIVR